jgi:hypothetical protein
VSFSLYIFYQEKLIATLKELLVKFRRGNYIYHIADIVFLWVSHLRSDNVHPISLFTGFRPEGR